MTWVCVFAVCIVLMLSLPMLPALLEWRYKRDATPLRVVREYDGKVTHFAVGFRRFLDANLPASPSSGAGMDAALANGSPCQFVGGNGMPSFTSSEKAARSTAKLIVGDVPLVLPTGYFFEVEMYAAHGIATGKWIAFRALLSDGDVRLGEGSDVIRWAHAAGSLEFGPGSRLHGRISSDTEIRLHRKTVFSRMHASVIRFGPEASPAAQNAVATTDLLPWQLPDCLLNQGAGRTLLDGDVVLPAGVRHDGSLVVRGRLHVGRTSLVDGSIKSGRSLRIAPGARVSGAAVSSQDMLIELGCRVKGPIVAEGRLIVESGCVIGSPDQPTTITAGEVRIAEGAVVHGTIWPRKEGRVVEATAGGLA